MKKFNLGFVIVLEILMLNYWIYEYKLVSGLIGVSIIVYLLICSKDFISTLYYAMVFFSTYCLSCALFDAQSLFSGYTAISFVACLVQGLVWNKYHLVKKSWFHIEKVMLVLFVGCIYIVLINSNILYTWLDLKVNFYAQRVYIVQVVYAFVPSLIVRPMMTLKLKLNLSLDNKQNIDLKNVLK